MTKSEQFDSWMTAALFGSTAAQQAARSSIRAAAGKQGIRLASIKPYYDACARGAGGDLTVPAINVRGMSYDFCRAIIRAAKATKTGAFVIEIARSEMVYGQQRPDDLAVSLLAAALREDYQGPLFLQGDHYKISPGKSEAENQQELHAIELLIDESLQAGFGQIDIDASTTIDLAADTPEKQQEKNGSLTAHFTNFIRSHEHFPIAIGGEIGEIGGQVSTSDDLRAFMSVYRRNLITGAGTGAGIGKVAIQTGTSHGGIPQPDGAVMPVNVAFNEITQIGRVARQEFGLAGVVQHGASTLPDQEFGRFPDAGCLEIHLSTGFQNLIFDHPDFPAGLTSEMVAYLQEQFADRRKPGLTDTQFIYRTRKNLWGRFKHELANLPLATRTSIATVLEKKVTSLFAQLRVAGSRNLIDRFVT